MANSPDVKKYVDLTVFDNDPVTVLNDMLQAARGLIPEWSPQVGNIEVFLAEVFALRSAELAATANRLPSATVEVLLQLFGMYRSDGARATAELSLNVTDTSVARIISSGTRFLYVNAVTNVSYIFVLDNNVVFSAGGSTTATASVTAEAIGTSYNFSADGAYLTALSSISFLESATFSVSPSGGASAETDETFFDRATTLLASYTSASTTADQIQFYIATNKTYANRVGVFNRRRYRNRDTTSTGYGYHDGSVLVAVGGLVSTVANAATELPVATSNLTDLYESLDERTPSGLTIDVMSTELASVDITSTFTLRSGFIAGSVIANIESALESYLNPNTWSFDDLTVRRNEIISIIDSVDGVDYVDSLLMNGESLIGTNNVGYYVLSGGSKTTTTLTITSGAANGTYTAGNAAFYYVDSSSDPDNPTVYTFVNTGDVVISGGTGSGSYIAVSNGVNFNDAANGGIIPVGATLIGSAGDSGGVAILGDATGGSDDTYQFTTLNGDGDGVSSDIFLRNLGTLVTSGTFNISVAV